MSMFSNLLKSVGLKNQVEEDAKSSAIIPEQERTISGSTNEGEERATVTFTDMTVKPIQLHDTATVSDRTADAIRAWHREQEAFFNVPPEPSPLPRHQTEDVDMFRLTMERPEDRSRSAFQSLYEQRIEMERETGINIATRIQPMRIPPIESPWQSPETRRYVEGRPSNNYREVYSNLNMIVEMSKHSFTARTKKLAVHISNRNARPDQDMGVEYKEIRYISRDRRSLSRKLMVRADSIEKFVITDCQEYASHFIDYSISKSKKIREYTIIYFNPSATHYEFEEAAETIKKLTKTGKLKRRNRIYKFVKREGWNDHMQKRARKCVEHFIQIACGDKAKDCVTESEKSRRRFMRYITAEKRNREIILEEINNSLHRIMSIFMAEQRILASELEMSDPSIGYMPNHEHFNRKISRILSNSETISDLERKENIIVSILKNVKVQTVNELTKIIINKIRIRDNTYNPRRPDWNNVYGERRGLRRFEGYNPSFIE